MTTRTHNRFSHPFLLAGAALLFGTGPAFAAADAQEQARSMLTGVAGKDVSFPTDPGSTASVDSQTQAQWLFAGRPQLSDRNAANVSQDTALADASNLARQLLAGKSL